MKGIALWCLGALTVLWATLLPEWWLIPLWVLGFLVCMMGGAWWATEIANRRTR